MIFVQTYLFALSSDGRVQTCSKSEIGANECLFAYYTRLPSIHMCKIRGNHYKNWMDLRPREHHTEGRLKIVGDAMICPTSICLHCTQQEACHRTTPDIDIGARVTTLHMQMEKQRNLMLVKARCQGDYVNAEVLRGEPGKGHRLLKSETLSEKANK